VWSPFGGVRSPFAAYCLLAFFIVTGPARADCPSNPDALGTSRTIAVDPSEHPFLGAFQYRESLPLNDREVVLTFDDGPLPPYTNRVLDVLAAECVKATFFIVGRMAHAYPQLVKRVHHEGHTLANHSQNHPFTFHKMPIEPARQEIEDGFASIRAALGDAEGSGVTRFFRIPGLLRQDAVEEYLSARGYMTWSVDVLADDWRRIRADEVVHRALNRLESRGKGILLLHDIRRATVLALPTLLRELKERGFKIVHVVEASSELPKTQTQPEQWAVRRSERAAIARLWPSADIATHLLPEPVLPAPDASNFRYWRLGGKPRRAERVLHGPGRKEARTASSRRSSAHGRHGPSVTSSSFRSKAHASSTGTRAERSQPTPIWLGAGRP